MSERQFFVYMLASANHVALYIGVTNNLYRRLDEHRTGSIDGFTKKYRCFKLVFFEVSDDVYVALEREKQIKRWRRAKKDFLIALENPQWNDIAHRL